KSPERVVHGIRASCRQQNRGNTARSTEFVACPIGGGGDRRRCRLSRRNEDRLGGDCSRKPDFDPLASPRAPDGGVPRFSPAALASVPRRPPPRSPPLSTAARDSVGSIPGLVRRQHGRSSAGSGAPSPERQKSAVVWDESKRHPIRLVRRLARAD